MMIIPAIDLKGGRCVRLSQGLEHSAKLYDRDPLAVAQSYHNDGAELLHVVDLDGAFLGATSANQSIVRKIAAEVDVPLEVGGGIRSLTDIETLISEIGVRFVVVGTIAVEQPEIIKRAVERFGDSIVVGIDARHDLVATRGWTQSTQITVLDLARQVSDFGISRIIYTDIARDGMLEGPNLEMTRLIARGSGLKVTASGGVSSLDDVARLCELESDGVDSVIIGKALYEERFKLNEAITTAGKHSSNT
jgi:phosphoribosylformimino-5-aminoimidazole carboxamide ribotide isomerase